MWRLFFRSKAGDPKAVRPLPCASLLLQSGPSAAPQPPGTCACTQEHAPPPPRATLQNVDVTNCSSAGLTAQNTIAVSVTGGLFQHKCGAVVAAFPRGGGDARLPQFSARGRGRPPRAQAGLVASPARSRFPLHPPDLSSCTIAPELRPAPTAAAACHGSPPRSTPHPAPSLACAAATHSGGDDVGSGGARPSASLVGGILSPWWGGVHPTIHTSIRVTNDSNTL